MVANGYVREKGNTFSYTQFDLQYDDCSDSVGKWTPHMRDFS